jgi:glycosyltransferase involved in cell wall biosynthesis
LIESLSELAARHSIEPTVLCVGRLGQNSSELEDALERRGLAHEVFWERGTFDRAPLRQIRARIEAAQPDAIQTHGYKPAAYALGLCRRGSGSIPWVAFYHGRTTTDWKVRLYHRFERWAMGRADIVATVAEGVEDHFRRSDRSRLVVIPNGVLPRPEFSTTVVEPASTAAPGGPVIGFVGRLSREKGPDLFVDSLAHLLESHPDLSGLIVGDGPMEESLRHQVGKLGLSSTIRFAGQVSNVEPWYRQMNVLAISSRSEVFPNVLLEAVDAGLTVAATPVGGIPSVARELGGVAVARDVSAASIAEAIAGALDVDSADRVRTRERMHEAYSQHRRAESLAALYRSLSEESR